MLLVAVPSFCIDGVRGYVGFGAPAVLSAAQKDAATRTRGVVALLVAA